MLAGLKDLCYSSLVMAGENDINRDYVGGYVPVEIAVLARRRAKELGLSFQEFLELALRKKLGKIELTSNDYLLIAEIVKRNEERRIKRREEMSKRRKL